MNEFPSLFRELHEDWQFLKGWIRKPGEVGSVVPTGKVAARAMAALVPRTGGLPVLELGPGTGVITQALLECGIAASDIVGIEYSCDFHRYLIDRFPGVNFIHGDAFRAEELLSGQPWQRFRAVVGAIPLLNFPRKERAALIETYLELMEPGSPFIQITYGPRPPTPARKGRYGVESTDWIMKNVPPARIFVYRREGG
jgi:phosphatidylethanolamine/phosphatidyl-N-methylethanolamine N-methyltransferase